MVDCDQDLFLLKLLQPHWVILVDQSISIKAANASAYDTQHKLFSPIFILFFLRVRASACSRACAHTKRLKNAGPSLPPHGEAAREEEEDAGGGQPSPCATPRLSFRLPISRPTAEAHGCPSVPDAGNAVAVRLV